MPASASASRPVDVLVAGGGMAGCFAALGAAADGLSVVLVEPSNVLGGQGTAGGVAGFCGDTERVNAPFAELVARLAAHDLIAPLDPHADRRAFDLEWCGFFLQEMVVAAAVEVLLHARLIGARAEAGRIEEVEVLRGSDRLRLTPRMVVDATGDCVAAHLAGFETLHEPENRQLPMSLYFTLWDTGAPVRPVLPPGCPTWDTDDDLPMTTLHRFGSGKVEVKMKVVGFDAADGPSLSRAEIHARRQMMGLIYHLQTKGYGGQCLVTHALASVSRHIGQREGRRIVGEHVLTEHEVTHAAVFDDAVAVGTYHLDYHWPDRAQRAGTGVTTMVEPYHIPLRSLVARGSANLLAAGRGLSGEQMAISSYRVQATCTQTGFAAGCAARVALRGGHDLRDLPAATVQADLRARGQSLDLSNYGGYLARHIRAHEFVFGGGDSGGSDSGGSDSGGSDSRGTGECAGAGPADGAVAPAPDIPFASCHAATLVQPANGRFLVAWFGGTREGADDVGVWGATRQGGIWSAPRLLAKVRGQQAGDQQAGDQQAGDQQAGDQQAGLDLPHWNPVLFVAPGEASPGQASPHPVHLFFKVSIPGRKRGAGHSVADGWQTWTTVSHDGGETFDTPRPLVAEGDWGWDLGRGPVKDKPIALADGTWLAGASVETDETWDVFVDRSEDGGRTWTATPLLALDRARVSGKGVIQPTLWESTPGQVHMLARSTGGAVYRADSDDGGRTWSPLQPTDLPNNNSGLDAARLEDGRVVLVCNPIPEGRTPLSLLVSADNGHTWPRRLDLEAEGGEYSYPAIVPVACGVAIAYTWRRERIRFWMGSPDHATVADP